MAFNAKGASPIEKPLGAARDAIPISASGTNNVFGNAYNVTNGGDARACFAILASGTTTFTGVTAAGNTRTGLVVGIGRTDLQLIQVTAITGGGGSLWALI